MMRSKPHSEKRFIELPNMLFTDPRYKQLSIEGKVLYSLLLDRSKLSQRNGKAWVTNTDEVFVYFTLETAQEMLDCGHDKATRTFRELESAQLIRRQPQGLGKPAKIVVYRPEHALEHSAFQTEENPQQHCGKGGGLDCEIPARSNTDINNIELLIKGFAQPLCLEYDPKQVDRVLEVVAEWVLCDTRATQNISAHGIQAEFTMLDLNLFRSVLDSLKRVRFTTEYTDTFILNLINEAIAKKRKDKQQR